MIRRSASLAAFFVAGTLSLCAPVGSPLTGASATAAPSAAQAAADERRAAAKARLRDRAGRKIGRQMRELAEAGASPSDQRAFLAAKLRDRRIPGATVDALLAHAVDGVSLRPTPAPRASHLGGPALALEGETWPTNRRSDRKLTLVAVLDLAELRAGAPLPPDGSLVLYYDADGVELDNTDAWMDIAANAVVRWIPVGSSTREVAAPSKVLAYPRQSVAGAVMPIIGDLGDGFDGPGSERIVNLALDTYYGVATGAYGPDQVLGASQDLQGPVVDEIPYWFKETSDSASRKRYSAAERRGEGWTLVAQISGGASEEMIFADLGYVSFITPTVDLAARKFDRTIAILQF